MTSIKKDWVKRGYISKDMLIPLQNLDNVELFKLLKSNETLERTSAAKLLSERKCFDAITPLCEALIRENALYSRIAISEALGAMGELSVSSLIDLLGKIGNNHHKCLPAKPFEKWSYPLPRDIAARTLTKIGENALVQLNKVIANLSVGALSEAIDAIGFISFYAKTGSSFKYINKIIEKHIHNDLIIWKTVVCLQSFKCVESQELLEYFMITHSQPAIRWEAARSLGQVCKRIPSSLIASTHDQNELVKYMCKKSIMRLNDFKE